MHHQLGLHGGGPSASRMPIPEPAAKRIWRYGQVGLRQLQRRAEGDGMVRSLVDRRTPERRGNLLRRHDRGKHWVRVLALMAPQLGVPPGSPGPSEPLVLRVRDDDLAV